MPASSGPASPGRDPSAPLRLTAGEFFVLGLDHHCAPPHLRDRLGLGDDATARLRATLRQEIHLAEHLLLSTCNRLEVYGVAADSGSLERLATALSSPLGMSPAEFLASARSAAGEAAACHLFAVASGLESQLLGETEILGQVKDAYETARTEGTLGARLHRLLQKALQTAKLVRTETGIARGQVSIGNVAVELATRIFGDLSSARLLIVGSGEVGELTAKAFHSRGARDLQVASRNPTAAARLAGAVGARPIPFTEWVSALPSLDIVVTATAAPTTILSAADVEASLRRRGGRPLFLIDLAVPHDIDSAAASLSQVYLYTLDDLAAIARDNLAARQVELGRAREIIATRVRRLLQADASRPAPGRAG